MKRKLSRLTALFLSALLLAQSAGALTLGAVLRQETLAAAGGTRYGTSTYWSSAANGRQTEHYYTYEPNSAVTPMVYYGTTLYGRSTLDTLAPQLAEAGRTVVAAVNGSFFDMANGVPYGLVVTDGYLRSSGDTQSVGFRADGTAVLGQPGLKVRLAIGGNSFTVHYNKALTAQNGMIVYSRDYDLYTKSAVKSYNVIVRPAEAGLTLSGEVEAEVLYSGEVYSAEIPEGCFTISMAADTPYASTLAQLKSLSAGDTVTITTACDAQWADVVYACGGGDVLVEGGAARTRFTLDSASKRTSRTAVGLKADGSLVVYTVDGLQSGYSLGLTLSELAARMVELGCVTAVNLDGGGSTTAALRYPGYDALTTVNKPSGGQQRACANFIVFTMPTAPAGETALLHLYPAQAVALPNAVIRYAVRATDADYRTTAVPGSIEYTASSGSITEEGVYTAGSVGVASVTAGSGAASGTAQVSVIASPASISIKNGASDVTGKTISVGYGKTVDLTAAAVWSGFPVYCSDRSFTWTVSGDIGTVDEEGRFTAGGGGATSGTVTASCGEAKATVSVTLTDLDRTPPLISVRLTDGLLTALITDDLSGIGEIQLTADDAPISYDWDGQTLTAAIADGVTIVKLTAADKLGNRAGASVETGYEAGNVFADLEGSWASKYVNYLYNRGVLQGAAGDDGQLIYNPGAPMTRQAFITSLIRYLGVDTSEYDTVSLPFADLGAVSGYALPALRAAYALGYLNGSNVNGALYAKPRDTITRQEAMAILGRSQKPGYAEDPLTAFSDAASVSAYARSYIAQMVTRGVISGSGGKLNPRGTVTRAQVAKMLYYLT